MAVCNLFKKLSKDTGNFYLFSQYADDMTKFISNRDSYIIIPSKFWALNIDYKSWRATDVSGTDKNEKVMVVLQNYFENARAYMKNHETSNLKWSPTMSLQTLIRALNDKGLINITPSNANNSAKINELQYIGDIDIQSYSETNNEGFSEIYCYIPNDSKQYTYNFEYSQTENKKLTDITKHIEGWETQPTGIVPITLPLSVTYTYDNILTNPDAGTATSAESYPVNTIIVLYKVVVKDSTGNVTTTYENIPMGIYFTGKCVSTGMSNPITKYVPDTAETETFGDGTSYGLRICTRFLCLPNDTIKITSTEVDTHTYAGFSQAMSLMAESQETMNEMISKFDNYSNGIKEHLAMFKNYRVNVPYVREVGGKSYWFVNGRNTGQTTVADALTLNSPVTINGVEKTLQEWLEQITTTTNNS